MPVPGPGPGPGPGCEKETKEGKEGKMKIHGSAVGSSPCPPSLPSLQEAVQQVGLRIMQWQRQRQRERDHRVAMEDKDEDGDGDADDDEIPSGQLPIRTELTE